MPPLREPTYFILASLLDGRRHGYGIVREAGALSGGRVRLTAGTLYGALERLAADSLVEVDGEDVVNGRRRRYYRLTSAGERALADEAERLSSSAKVVTQRLAGLQRLRMRENGA
jgi:DNA-binding PadR family transcriptional regulator